MSLGKMKILILCVVLSTFITNTHEDQDFFTVFRIGRPYTGVQTELHRLTNVIGLPLRTRNGFFIDSVADMPSLKCSPAIEGCGWTKSGNWIYSPVNVSQDEDLSVNIDYDFNLHGYYETCDDYNGGCEFWCSNDPGGQKCICPTGGRPQPEDKTCGLIMKVERSGYFESDSRYPVWHIIPPVNSTTEITILSSQYFISSHEVSRERDRNSLSHGSRHHVIIENDNFVRLEYSYNFKHGHRYHPFSGKIDMKRNHLTLNDEQGTLKYEFNTIVDTICISVTYKAQSNYGSVNMQVSLPNGTDIQLNSIQEHTRENWIQKLFYAKVERPNTYVKINVEVNGQGTTIYSINGCSPYGTQEVTLTKLLSSVPSKVYSFHQTWPSIITYDVPEDSSCLNGGSSDWKTIGCICPAGFTGRRCEEGCGPNSYGSDCSATCSDYDWGCSGMIFCKRELPCLCAPGFHSENCDEKCAWGKYGANCSQECGKCVGMTCDIYTGVCHEGCESGFHPPLCANPYKYLKFSPVITHDDFQKVKICFNVSSMKGEGDIKYYQIHYMDREEAETNWIKTWFMPIEEQFKLDGFICDNITGLSPGHKYSARVVLIDMDGSSYQGELVPQTNFTTLCSVSRSKAYRISHTSASSSFILRWQYETNYTDCRIKNYTVVLKMRWQEIEIVTEDKQFTIENLIPSTEYKVKIRANTEIGSAPFSSWHSIKTDFKAPRHVPKLTLKPEGKKKLLISWTSRKDEKSLDKYIIKYKCIQYLACTEPAQRCEGDEEMELAIDANKTSVSLNDLHSHAVYMIKVAGVAGEFVGPFTSVRSATADTAPDVAPTMSDNPIVSSTNTSAIVQWKPSSQCNLFNGYFAGYRYELLFLNETLIQEGITRRPNATFYDLLPQETYTVNVFLISSGGINRNTKISFNVSTKATVPSEVRYLTVYKRGRRIIGLRWKEPRNIYGEISSFSVSHCLINGDCVNEVISRIPPSSCSAWPDYYCHTINKQLHPNKRYSVTVKARNKEVDEDGNSVTITASTSEGVPETPVELNILNQTSQSITIQWKPPFTFNGILRSFLVNVEHIDSANASNCCVYFPLHEIPVMEEKETYIHEINGLSPAAKYVIGISAKTLSIGLSSTLMANTPPEVPTLNAPEVIDDGTILVPSQDEVIGVTSTYLLIVIPENGNVDSKIFDSHMKEKLQELITENFYVIGEFSNEDLPVTVSYGSDFASRNNTYAVVQNTEIPEKFRVGLAVVLDYNGAKNIGFVTSVEKP